VAIKHNRFFLAFLLLAASQPVSMVAQRRQSSTIRGSMATTMCGTPPGIGALIRPPELAFSKTRAMTATAFVLDEVTG
jgi:hypothetical protein